MIELIRLECKEHKDCKMGEVEIVMGETDSNYPFYTAGETAQGHCKKCPPEKRNRRATLEAIKRNGKSIFKM